MSDVIDHGGMDVTVGRQPYAGPPSVIPMSQVPSGQIRVLQEFLNRNGYICGPADGIYGPRTQAALHAFQQANGLEVSDTYTVGLANYVIGGQTPIQGSGSSPSTVGGGGLPVSTTGASQGTSSDLEEIKKRFPTMAFYLDHPEIGPILRDALAQNMTPDQLWGRLIETNWWKERSASARQWESLVNTDPGEANRQRGRRRLEIQQAAQRFGIVLTDQQLTDIVEQSLAWSWNENEWMQVLGAAARNQPAATHGQLGDSATTLRNIARNYLIPINEKDIREWAILIMEGSQTEASFEQWVRGQSKARFTWLADEIDRGIAPAQYFAPIRETVSRLLEINIDDIDLTDPQWSELTEFVDDNGNRRGMTLAEARQWARNRPEWARTDNARQDAANMVNQLGTIFGKF